MKVENSTNLLLENTPSKVELLQNESIAHLFKNRLNNELDEKREGSAKELYGYIYEKLR